MNQVKQYVAILEIINTVGMSVQILESTGSVTDGLKDEANQGILELIRKETLINYKNLFT